MTFRRALSISFALVCLVLLAAPVQAHGILRRANPAPDSTVQRVPEEVVAILTEAPVPNGTFVVKDGCGRTVNEGFEVADTKITAVVGDAQPGAWRVRFDFISSIDGHRYEQTYAFRVSGKKDCSAPDEDESAAMGESSPGDDPSAHAGEGSAAGHDGMATSDEGGFPIVPAVALGSIVLVGVALLARRSVHG